MREPTLNPEYELPAGVTPATRCQYCNRPFRREHARALHLGEVHEEECTAAEKAAYEEAMDAEREELFYFHMKVIVALGSIYGVVVLLYMIALGSGIL